jgi:hypothetical protein
MNMKKLLALAVLCVSSAMLTGCVFPMKGATTAALTLEHTVSDPIVDNSVRAIKRGESYGGGILFFSTGDNSIDTAMRNGGITKVHHVNYKVMNILYLYNETVTIVYGE